MRAKEIVEGDEQGGDGDGSVASLKAAGGADVILVGAVETFDELLEGAELGGDLVTIFQTDDLQQAKGGLLGRAMGIEEVHAGLIRGIAVGNKAKGLILRQGTSGFAQSHGGG
jgi:hypothetical protein